MAYFRSWRRAGNDGHEGRVVVVLRHEQRFFFAAEHVSKDGRAGGRGRCGKFAFAEELLVVEKNGDEASVVG